MPYEALYVEHEPAARRLALALVPPHAAEDVVSEAFTRVLDTAARNGPPEAFGPYLLRAVRNTALRYHDQGRRLVPVPAPEPAPAPGPDAVAADREDARLAAAAFRTLPERWRQVLWATAVEEVTIAALANRWNMTANGVSQLASRAREGLRQAYLTEHLGAVQGRACREVAPFMGAAVRGRAGRRRQQQLAAHLRTCEPCGQAYAGLGALNTRLGELLAPGAVLAGGTALLGKVLPAARVTARGWHLHAPLLTLGAVASAAGIATLQLAVPAHPHATAVPAAAAPAPGASVQASGGASTGPVAAVPLSSGGAGAPAPVSGTVGSIVPQAVSAVTSAAGQLAGGAGQAVSQAGKTAGTTVTQAGQTAGRAVTGVTSAAAGTGQAAGGAVSGVSGTAGQLVQSVTGSVGGVLGGL